MDIERSFDRFVKDRQAMQVSESHIRQLRYKFNLFGAFLKSHDVRDTSELNSDLLADFLLSYIKPSNGRRYSDWYIRGIANTVRAYIRFLAEMRIIQTPIQFKMPKFHRPLPQLIDVVQMQKIIDSCSV